MVNIPRGFNYGLIEGNKPKGLFESMEYHETPLGLKIWMACDKGSRDHNEDCVAFAETQDGLIAVDADGMGGHSKGEVASLAVCEGMLEQSDDPYYAGLKSAQEKIIRKKAFGAATCFVAAKIRKADGGNFRMDRLRGGDCRGAIILPDYSVIEETSDLNFATAFGRNEEEILRMDNSSQVFHGLNANVDVRSEYKELIENDIDLPPGSLIYMASDGSHGCANPGEFVEFFLRRANGDVAKAIELFSASSTNRMKQREKFRKEIESGAWKANGGKCSDGFTHMPPKDNRSIVLIQIPGENFEAQAHVTGNTARGTSKTRTAINWLLRQFGG